MITLSIEDTEYPRILRKISNPPKKLHLKGNIDLLKNNGIAIIGSRNCTEYGKKMAKKFSSDLSLYGLNIISGMAKGIDSLAHLGSLEVKGNTIAVLPSGFNHIYPKENIYLYKKILDNNGLVITEYKEDEEATSNKFLERNRVVSGLAIGTLVVEGGYRSGTSVTARLTKQQGKKVFCIPSNLDNSKGFTTNKLIRNGACIVTKAEDIVEEYPEFELKRREINLIEERKVEENEDISPELRKIYNILNNKTLMHINEVVAKSKMNINEVSYKLMLLELEDKIVSFPGDNYKRK